jgi:hypothetical protein
VAFAGAEIHASKMVDAAGGERSQSEMASRFGCGIGYFY